MSIDNGSLDLYYPKDIDISDINEVKDFITDSNSNLLGYELVVYLYTSEGLGTHQFADDPQSYAININIYDKFKQVKQQNTPKFMGYLKSKPERRGKKINEFWCKLMNRKTKINKESKFIKFS